MCPEESLLSSYLDDELESRFAERIEGHVKDCHMCNDKLEALRGMRALFTDADEPDYRSSMVRVLRRIEVAEAARVSPSVALRRRRLAVSVPAAAAVCVLALSIGFVTALFTRKSDLNFRMLQIRREPSGTTFQVAAPIEDLEQLIKAFGNDSSREITINLPELPEEYRFIMLAKEPTFLREFEAQQVAKDKAR